MLDDLKKIEIPQAEALTASAQGSLRMAKAYDTISSDDEYGEAAEELQAIKAKAKALEERRMSITRPLDAAKKAVMDLFRGPSEALAEGEKIIKNAMIAWDDKKEEQAKAAAAAAEAAARIERESLQAQAEQAAAAGNTEAAAAAAMEAEMVTAVVAATEAPKTAGISQRESWEYEVTDLLALVKHIVNERPDMIGLVVVDSVRMRNMVKALGKEFRYPGVRVFSKKSIAAKAAA